MSANDAIITGKMDNGTTRLLALARDDGALRTIAVHVDAVCAGIARHQLVIAIAGNAAYFSHDKLRAGVHSLFLDCRGQLGAGDALRVAGEILDFLNVDDLGAPHHSFYQSGV